MLILGLLAAPAKAQTVESSDAGLALAAAAIGAAPVSVLVLPEGTPDLASDLLSSLAYAAGQSTELLNQSSQATLLAAEGSLTVSPDATAQAGEAAPAAAAGESGPPVALARVGVRYTTEGAGYRDGFTTFEGFVPLFQTPGENLTFLEGRLLLLSNSTVGTNIVVGQRFYNASDQRVYGGYISYDNRDTGRTFFNQVGFGLEALSDALDLRLNAYFPVGTTRNQIGTQTAPTVAFSGNSLLINTMRQFESAATVVDAEVGTRLFPLGDVGAVRGYAGTYYINAQGSPDVVGIRGRLEAKASDFFNLNLMLQNDSLFDTRFVVSVGLNFPGPVSPSQSGEERYQGLERIGDSVVRQSAILVADPSVRGQSETRSEQAINARTGRPYRIVHVASGSGGTGTNESPLGSVQAALGQVGDGDIVYVRGNGNETFAASPVIPSGVGLLFSRLPQLTPDPVVQFGQRIPLPATYLNAGDRYVLNIPGTLTITGNNVTVAGLTITNPAGPGIQATGVSNLTLTGNTINNAAGPGIALTNVTGNLSLTGNVVNGTTGPALNSGIVLQNDSGVVNFDISGNTTTGTTNNGIGLLFRGTAQGAGTITNNTISGNQSNGISVQAVDGAQVTLTISSNQVFNNAGVGIDLRTANAAVMRATIESNPQISGNGQGGIRLLADNASTLFTRVRLNPAVTGNGVLLGDLNFNAPTAGSTARLCLVAEGNTFGTAPTGNGAAGTTVQVENGIPGAVLTGTAANVPAGTCGF